MANPVHLRGDPAFLDRTSERALRTVPVRRTSGSPAAPAPRAREGSEQVRNVVIFPRPCDRCGRRDYTFSPSPEGPGELPAFAASNRPISGRLPTPEATGEMRATGGCIDPSRQGSPRGIRRRNGAPLPPPALNLPAPVCGALPFTSRQLHVLLNSLFKVLFNFPSWYLSSIGLVLSI